VTEIYARAGVSGLWTQGSSFIARFCDLRIRHYFQGDSPLCWEEFEKLTPEELHGLLELHPVQRRAPSWYSGMRESKLHTLHTQRPPVSR
jgi:hypothetical protein